MGHSLGPLKRETCPLSNPHQVLGTENRRRAKALGWGPDGSPAPDLDSNSRIKALAAGAHVIAPCPHDGSCPMEVWLQINVWNASDKLGDGGVDQQPPG